MGNCFAMLVIVSLVLTVVFWVFARPMLMTFGASENTIGYALEYMQIYALGTAFVEITLGHECVYYGPGLYHGEYENRPHRRHFEYDSGSHLYFRPGFGSPGRSPGHHFVPGGIHGMGAPVFAGEEHEVRLRRELLRPKAKVVLPCLALGMSPFIMQSTESLIAVCFNASLYRYGGDHCPSAP